MLLAIFLFSQDKDRKQSHLLLGLFFLSLCLNLADGMLLFLSAMMQIFLNWWNSLEKTNLIFYCCLPGLVCHFATSYLHGFIQGYWKWLPCYDVKGGLSVAADYRGKIYSGSDFYNEENKQWIFELPIGHVNTVYAAVGDWVAYSSIIIMAVALLYLIAGLIKRKFFQKSKSMPVKVPAY